MARASKLTGAEWLMLLEAAGLLVALQIGLRVVSVRRIADWCAAGRGTTPAASRVAIERLVRMTEAAARRVPGSACLTRSLTLVRMLSVRGIESELKIGVRADAGAVEGHAWVERDGRPINDDLGVAAKYTLIEIGMPSAATTWRAASR